MIVRRDVIWRAECSCGAWISTTEGRAVAQSWADQHPQEVSRGNRG